MVKMVDDFLVISYRAVWSGGGGSLVDLFLLAMRTASEPCVVFIFWFLFVWVAWSKFWWVILLVKCGTFVISMANPGLFLLWGFAAGVVHIFPLRNVAYAELKHSKTAGWMCVSLSDRLLHTWTHHLQSTANCVISLSKHHLETVFPHFDWTTKQFLAWVLPWFEVALMGPTSEVIPPHGTNAVDDAPDTDSDCVMPKDK